MQAGSDSDAPLIDASREGNRSAFAQIIERHHRAVYAVAYSGVRDHARAEDITQDTFVLAWGRLDDLRDSDRLAAWLCGIARNLARDVRRRLQRETLGDVTEPVDATTPYEVLTDAESERLIAAGLADVPDVYREPMVLFYYQDRSVEDVARALGITPATTNKRLSRGRRFLAERVATIVEHGLARRGPTPALVGSVVAAIALLPAPHVDASTLKGSTMSKLAIATAITAVAGGITIFAATTMRGTPAHAKSPEAAVTPVEQHGDSCLDDFFKQSKTAATATASSPHAATHAAAAPSLTASEAPETPTDCTAVGRHLAELEADATHGPTHRPDEATCAKCSAHYTTVCESEGWTAERRACSLAAADMFNAHLCAGAQTQSTAPATTLAPELQCAALAAHVTPIVQGAHLYDDIPDLAQQIESACKLGNWSTDMRQCLAAGTNIPALKACIDPNATH